MAGMLRSFPVRIAVNLECFHRSAEKYSVIAILRSTSALARLTEIPSSVVFNQSEDTYGSGLHNRSFFVKPEVAAPAGDQFFKKLRAGAAFALVFATFLLKNSVKADSVGSSDFVMHRPKRVNDPPKKRFYGMYEKPNEFDFEYFQTSLLLQSCLSNLNKDESCEELQNEDTVEYDDYLYDQVAKTPLYKQMFEQSPEEAKLLAEERKALVEDMELTLMTATCAMTRTWQEVIETSRQVREALEKRRKRLVTLKDNPEGGIFKSGDYFMNVDKEELEFRANQKKMITRATDLESALQYNINIVNCLRKNLADAGALDLQNSVLTEMKRLNEIWRKENAAINEINASITQLKAVTAMRRKMFRLSQEDQAQKETIRKKELEKIIEEVKAARIEKQAKDEQSEQSE